ncbi:Molybdopterin synthase sulfur carrier subunit [Escovopsis weberi]|uniref:Molybdopterin synthase sulfur carrier subunit n=1 Tax=Escovopsis weberi TaxID=150374 RepID=A0A0M8N878_ESCWE|nr:Molybdopterin synthase sulfur carrier subunit [Escovopsis weberi]
MSAAPPGHFTVLYFAGASAFTGKDADVLPAPLALGGLFAELEARYAGMRDRLLGACLVTVNLEYVDVAGEDADRVVIREGDEVAIIPPLPCVFANSVVAAPSRSLTLT